MDKTILIKQMEILREHYPALNITQLGFVTIWLGLIRASMGHENAIGTIENYIHPSYLSKDIKECLNFLEREVLGIKKSKIDIDFWKRGKEGAFRRNTDLIEAK